MAEYVEVMRNHKRMCDTLDCERCPLSHGNNQADLYCDTFIEQNPDVAETIIMKWAKANPEPKLPKYPTWYEYFRDNKDYPIPEAIAKQLGLEPIK